MDSKFTFSLNDEIDDPNNREYMLKISSDYYELNILLSKDELLQIPGVVNARWDERTCLKLGDCLGNPTWWSLENEGLSILVGTDPEVWQFGVIIAQSKLEDLLNEIDANETRFLSF